MSTHDALGRPVPADTSTIPGQAICAQCARERERGDYLLAALKELLRFDAIVEANDKGPPGEGWQSTELVAALGDAEVAIARADASAAKVGAVDPADPHSVDPTPRDSTS